MTFLTAEMMRGIIDDLAQRGITERDYDIDTYAWPQAWPSTALGFGGMGGSMITSAITTVMVVDHEDAYVYFNGIPAYRCTWRRLAGCAFGSGSRFPRTLSVRDAVIELNAEVLRIERGS